MRRSLAAAGVWMGVATIIAPSAHARPFRFDDLAKVQRLGGISLSPDGQWIAYAVSTPDPDANLSRSAIWLVATGGGAGAPRKLTSGEKRDADPAFSPDGKRVAFLSNRDGSWQVWLADLAGGEPSKATSFPTGVDSFRWAPDGRSFVVASAVFPDCSDVACLDRKAKARDKAVIQARVTERLLFRHWDAWQDGLRSHLWRIPLESAAPAVDLTPGEHDAPTFEVGGGTAFEVSPDSKELVWASNHDRVEATSTNSDLWIAPYSGTGGKAASLTASNPAWDGSPEFSPDGRSIAYRAQKRPGAEADRFTLMVLDRASGQSRELTPDFDDWVEEIAWAPDSKSIYFVSHEKAHGVVYRVGADGSGRRKLWTGGSPRGLRVARDGRRIYFASSTALRPEEIWMLRLDGVSPSPTAERVTRINDRQFDEGAYGLNASERWVDSADGRKLQGWLVLPPGFDASKKYPAVLLIHGGPQGAWTDGWSYRWNPQVFAGYGYVVYAANPRGSTGFGQKFLDEISGDWGGKAYDDLMRQADDLFSLPYVDRTKVGAAGASYGGWMVDWIAGHSDRFAALVTHDGVFDPGPMALETEELWFPRHEFGGWPWQPDTVYEKWNPSRFIDHFKTPTLVVHGERDYRVPFGQGLQMFTALQLKGVPSKLLTFPDEGHWVLKPGNSRLWHATVMDWLHRYLGGAEADPKALETVYSTAPAPR
jgi:dipeptidyl aminopeptidase/acylaminoacyl peptidase